MRGSLAAWRAWALEFGVDPAALGALGGCRPGASWPSSWPRTAGPCARAHPRAGDRGRRPRHRRAARRGRRLHRAAGQPGRDRHLVHRPAAGGRGSPARACAPPRGGLRRRRGQRQALPRPVPAGRAPAGRRPAPLPGGRGRPPRAWPPARAPAAPPSRSATPTTTASSRPTATPPTSATCGSAPDRPGSPSRRPEVPAVGRRPHPPDDDAGPRTAYRSGGGAQPDADARRPGPRAPVPGRPGPGRRGAAGRGGAGRHRSGQPGRRRPEPGAGRPAGVAPHGPVPGRRRRAGRRPAPGRRDQHVPRGGRRGADDGLRPGRLRPAVGRAGGSGAGPARGRARRVALLRRALQRRYAFSYGRGLLELAVTAGAIGVLVVACWSMGLVKRARLQREAAMLERAQLLELERDQEVRLAASTERARIAREMHDVVAHPLSVVNAQADGGRYAGRTDPEAAVGALEQISATGRRRWPTCARCWACCARGTPRSSPRSPTSPPSRRWSRTCGAAAWTSTCSARASRRDGRRCAAGGLPDRAGVADQRAQARRAGQPGLGAPAVAPRRAGDLGARRRPRGRRDADPRRPGPGRGRHARAGRCCTAGGWRPAPARGGFGVHAVLPYRRRR